MKLIERSQIDTARWNNTIQNSQKPVIYAESWFLDIVSPNWKALVNSDYSLLFPIPLKRKFGLPYALQPHFTQQLGCFYLPNISIDANTIISALKKTVIHFNLKFNSEHNSIINFPYNSELKNHYIPLNKSFAELSERFSKSHIKNLNRAKRFTIEIRPVHINMATEFYRKEYPKVVKDMDVNIFDIFQKLFAMAELNANAYCYGAFVENKLTSAICLLHTNKHMFTFYIASELGKKKKVLFKLIEYVLKKYSESNLVFDFGGSNIPGIAYFNKGFGADEETYYQLTWNKFIPKQLLFKM